MCRAQTHSAPQQRWASLGQGTLHRWDGPPRDKGSVQGRSAHLALVSPEVTGPGLDMGARVNGPPRGQGPSAAGVRLPGAGPPAPCPVLGQRPRPLLPHRIKRKRGVGGGRRAGGRGCPSQLRPGDSALTRSPGQRPRPQAQGWAMSLQALRRVCPSPTQHSTKRTGQLSTTQSSGRTAPPGLPPASRPLLPGWLPSVWGVRLTASQSKPRPPPRSSAGGKHPPRPVTGRAHFGLGVRRRAGRVGCARVPGCGDCLPQFLPRAPSSAAAGPGLVFVI